MFKRVETRELEIERNTDLQLAMLQNWPLRAPEWSREEHSLLPPEIAEPPHVPLPSLLEKSELFPLKFPIDSNRCKTLKTTVSGDTLDRNINSAYPIVHENVLHLYAKFILHKRQYGNSIEKSIYQDMDLLQFVDRLLTKRAIMFMGKHDSFILRDGKKGSNKWETIGTINEKAPLLLKDYISYEEIKLSAFLSVSSYTYFVNVGDRKNFGVFKEEREGVQDEGIIMGLIGPRLVKPNVMEYQELVITEAQNTKKNGYGDVTPPTIHHLFSKFYDEECLEYKDVVAKKNHLPKTSPRYTVLTDSLLDNFLYYKRLIFTMDTFFVEANDRAAQQNTTAYLHVVGIGLGVWKKHKCQNKIFMDSCGRRLQLLGKHLPHVSDVCFSYIGHNACLTYKHGDTILIEGHPLKGIKLHMYKREPHARLTRRDAGKLLVVSYAWDGNALPGNEFWNKKLGSSGDSAAASSTQITELHNPFINAKVCAANLRVVSEGKVVMLGEYGVMVKKGKKRKNPE